MSAYRDAVLATPGLVAYWRLGEAAGVAIDSGPGADDATWSGTPERAIRGLLVDDSDGAVRLSGDDFATAALPLFPSAAFTMLAWMATTDATTDMEVFSAGSNRASLRRFTSRRLNFGWRDALGTGRTISSPAEAVPADGKPHLVAGTHDGVWARIYVDGVEVAASNTFDAQPIVAATWRIGEATSAGSRRFIGELDEIATWSRALGPGEIAHLYAAGSSRQPAPAPQAIEAWITGPDGTYVAHLDRSPSSPFRHFTFYVERAIDGPGGGSLEYHPDNALLAEHPDLLAKGNLVWMRYRGRTVTWIVEEEAAALNADEHASEWRVVAGAGVLQLLADRLVFPPDFDPDTANGRNPQTWTTQWREAVNVAAGELLWDLIDESNARFATQIVQGTIDNVAGDELTVRHRFENLLADVVIPALEVTGADVRMDGLTFSYRSPAGANRTDAVVFEEGADIRDLQVTTSEREAVTWVVGEGRGEGRIAKLAVASRSATRRREAFLAAKDAANVPLLQLMTDAALVENGTTRAVELTIDEHRHRAFLDFDLNDEIRAVAGSHDVDDVFPIVALYVGEDGDQVRVDVDLGAVREDDELRLDRQLRQTRSSIGIRDRQPQGQLVPYPISGLGLIATGAPLHVDFRVPDSIFVLVRTIVQLSFSQFWAPAIGVASGGGSTSGASSSSTSAGGGTFDATHNHGFGQHVSDTPGAFTKRRYQKAGGGAGPDFNLETSNTNDVTTQVTLINLPAHDHGIPHTHSTPAHAHDLSYGIFKEAMPASIDVVVGVYKRNGSSWDLVTSISGITDEIEDLDLSAWIDGAGSWRLAIESAVGAPQGGRLQVSVAGSIEGGIETA